MMTTEKHITPPTHKSTNNATTTRHSPIAEQVIKHWVSRPYLIICFSCDPDFPDHIMEMACLESDGHILHQVFSPKHRHTMSRPWLKRRGLTKLDFHRAVRWSFLHDDLLAVFNNKKYRYRLTDSPGLLRKILHKRCQEQNRQEARALPKFTGVVGALSQMNHRLASPTHTAHLPPHDEDWMHYAGMTINARNVASLRPVLRCQWIRQCLQSHASLQPPLVRQ